MKFNKIFVAGHNGMLGSAILRQLKKKRKNKIIVSCRSRLNLENQLEVDKFFKKNKPEIVFLAAAKVGGILANIKYPADFILKNSLIQNNIFISSIKYNVKRLIFLGSSCMYPKNFSKKIKEDDILSSYPEDTNRAYAIAKISGLIMCESFNQQYYHGKKKFRCIIPPNLFGPGDNYHKNDSHVIAALIKKFHEAKKYKKKQVEVWGNGNVRREFMHVDDVAKACIKISNLSDQKYKKIVGKKNCHINIGSGKDYTIKKLSFFLKKISNFNGKIVFNKKMPVGVNRKLMDNSLSKKLKLFKNHNFYQKLKETYQAYK